MKASIKNNMYNAVMNTHNLKYLTENYLLSPVSSHFMAIHLWISGREVNEDMYKNLLIS